MPLLSFDEIQIISKAHCFFKLVQTQWLKRMETVEDVKITEENIWNMQGGGDVLIYDLMEQLKIAMAKMPETCDSILFQLKPEVLLNRMTNNPQNRLDFCVYRIANKVVETG